MHGCQVSRNGRETQAFFPFSRKKIRKWGILCVRKLRKLKYFTREKGTVTYSTFNLSPYKCHMQIHQQNLACLRIQHFFITWFFNHFLKRRYPRKVEMLKSLGKFTTFMLKPLHFHNQDDHQFFRRYVEFRKFCKIPKKTCVTMPFYKKYARAVFV